MFTKIMLINKYINLIKQNKILISLYLIVLIGILLRFWGYPVRYGFDIDATRDAILTQYASLHSFWPLIGPISALGSFNFGPWYYYQLILFQHLFPLSYAPWIYVSLTSVAVILVMYKIGVKLVSKGFGLLLALLTAFSSGQIIAGTGLSNPDLISLFVALSLLLFIQLLKSEGKSLTALLLGLLIGIGINNHYQMIYYIFLPFLLFIFCKKEKLKILLFSLLGIFLSFLPLIYFNITHHYQTVSGLIDYYILGKNKVYVPNRWLLYIFDFWPSLWGYLFGLPPIAGLLLMIGSIFTSMALIIKKKVSFSYSIIFIFFAFCFLSLRFFSGERVSYYLLFLHPLIIILTGILAWQLLKIRFGKILFGFCILTIVFFGLKVALVHIHSVDSHVRFESRANFLKTHFPNKQFAIYACNGQYKDEVFGMIFLLSNNKKLGNDIKIGFKDAHCRYPQGIKEDKNLDTIGAINLSPYSIVTLNNLGWNNITPDNLYSSLLGN